MTGWPLTGHHAGDLAVTGNYRQAITGHRSDHVLWTGECIVCAFLLHLSSCHLSIQITKRTMAPRKRVTVAKKEVVDGELRVA